MFVLKRVLATRKSVLEKNLNQKTLIAFRATGVKNVKNRSTQRYWSSGGTSGAFTTTTNFGTTGTTLVSTTVGTSGTTRDRIYGRVGLNPGLIILRIFMSHES